MTRIIFLCLLLALGSCSRYDAVRIARAAATRNPAAAAESIARSKAMAYAMNPAALGGDLKRFEQAVKEFADAVAKIWGKDGVRVPRPKEYVKYTQNYLSRASVDFDAGLVTVETVDTKTPLKSLRSAIVTTLLTPGDPRAVDLYSATPVKLGETPFLLGEVKDFEGTDVRWEWRAGRFADHLLEHDLKERTSGGKKARYVTIPMVPDHLNVRAAKYRKLVKAASRRFGVSGNLIYAIMKVESDFNPFAVSSAMAVGLMQVVPSTAGSDVYRFLNKRKGTPSADDLFQPPTNITYGTAYLHLLDTRYLKGVSSPVSREYCMIAGYNGGAGNVLRTFDADKGRATARINELPPDTVYSTLRNKAPYAEMRRYLGKVLEAKKQFVNFQARQQ